MANRRRRGPRASEESPSGKTPAQSPQASSQPFFPQEDVGEPPAPEPAEPTTSDDERVDPISVAYAALNSPTPEPADDHEAPIVNLLRRFTAPRTSAAGTGEPEENTAAGNWNRAEHTGDTLDPLAITRDALAAEAEREAEARAVVQAAAEVVAAAEAEKERARAQRHSKERGHEGGARRGARSRRRGGHDEPEAVPDASSPLDAPEQDADEGLFSLPAGTPAGTPPETSAQTPGVTEEDAADSSVAHRRKVSRTRRGRRRADASGSGSGSQPTLESQGVVEPPVSSAAPTGSDQPYFPQFDPSEDEHDGAVAEAGPEPESDGQPVLGWTFHRLDENGFQGWLYHYADGSAVKEDGSSYVPGAPAAAGHADSSDLPEDGTTGLGATHSSRPGTPPISDGDGGWMFHTADSTNFEGWLYHHSDGTLVAGFIYDVDSGLLQPVE